MVCLSPISTKWRFLTGNSRFYGWMIVCNDCHTILGFGAYYAPDMTKAYFRLGENNIVSIII